MTVVYSDKKSHEWNQYSNTKFQADTVLKYFELRGYDALICAPCILPNEWDEC